MPREIFNIPAFSKGIIAAVDEADIPLDSAVFSLNVDGDAVEGILCGRPYTTDYTSIHSAIMAHPFTKDHLTYDLLYQEGGDNNQSTLKISQDYLGSPTISTLKTLNTDNPVSMISRHREVRVGIPNENPLWIGYPEEEQFNRKTTTIQCLPANISLGITVPYLYKIAADGDYIYGIEWKGTRIFKIDNESTSVGTVTYSDEFAFTSLQGICIASATHLWVYDAGVGTYGTLYYVLKSDLSIVCSHTLQTTVKSAVAGIEPSDLMVTTNKVYIANSRQPNLTESSYSGWVFQAPKPSPLGTSAPITFTDVTPFIGYQAAYEEGSYYQMYFNQGWQYTGNNLPISYVPRTCLIDLGSDKIGWITVSKKELPSGVYGAGKESWTYYCTTGGVTPSGVPVEGIIHIIGESQVAAGKVPIYYFSDANDILGMIYTGSVIFGCKGNGYFKDASPGSVPTLKSTPTALTWEGGSNSTVGFRRHAICYSSDNTLMYLSNLEEYPGFYSIATDYTSVVIREEDDITLGTFTTSGTVIFDSSKKVWYKFALEYDGYQLSPLSIAASAGDSTEGRTNATPISIDVAAILNPRMSGLAIFRATCPSASSVPDGLYRLVEILKFNDPRWVTNGVKKELTWTDNNESAGAPYETITGIPETEWENMIQYELACTCNDELFVTKCSHKDFPDAQQLMFKSQTGRYDMFNLTQNYLRLPFVPTAIASWGGKVFAFSADTMLVINPDGMFIEEVVPAYGCLSQRSLYSAIEGLYFCNFNGIYRYNGKGIEDISLPIKQVGPDETYTGGQNYAVSSIAASPIIVPHPSQNTILFLLYTASTIKVWVWNYVRKRWDYWTLVDTQSYNHYGGFADHYGRAWISGDAQMYICNASTTRCAWTWVSQWITVEDPSQIKKFYEILSNYSGTISLYVRKERDEDFYLIGNLGALLYQTTPSFEYFIRSKGVQFKLEGAVDSLCYDISVIFRRMVGKRA